MQNFGMVKKITWLLVFRLALTTLFLSIGIVIFKSDRTFFYFAIASVYFLSLVYLIILLRKKMLHFLAAIQLFIDCFFVSVIVLYTGSVESVFTILYILVILAASVAVSPLAGMIATGLTCCFYLGQLVIAFNGFLPNLGIPVYDSDFFLVIYTAHVHIVTFLLAGILSSFLAKTIFKMEERVKERERTSMMGELAAEIAHEIRNPLAMISGSVEILSEELSDSLKEDNKKLMNVIVSEAERVSDIFEQFLDFSKFETMEFSANSIKTILEEIVFLIQHNSSLKDVKIQTDFCEDTCNAECSRNRIKQVFWNIIKNGLDAMDEGGVLKVKCYKNARFVMVEVTDEGVGMSPEFIKSLFRPFKTTKSSGIGLGLVAANRIIQKHGGSIEVISKPGVGTKFTVTIPRQHE